jgi:hypothetical protein
MGRGVKSVCAADHREPGILSINNLVSWHADLRIASSDQVSCRSKSYFLHVERSNSA